MQINLLFPTPVYYSIDEKDVCKRDQLREKCLEITQDEKIQERVNPYHRVSTSYKVIDDLHTIDAFAPLVEYIEENARQFLEKLGFPRQIFRIVRMWTNVGKKGDFVYPHTHVGEAIFSGVYYVSVDNRDGISIHDPVDRFPPKEFNPLNLASYSYEGIPGRLLMFRAETLHSTFPQEGEERIIISFNLQFIDET